MAYLAVLPGGNNISKLTQRYAGHETTTLSHTPQFIKISGEGSRDTNRYQLVLHILLRSLVSILGLHLHVHVVVTLPSRTDSKTLTIAEGHLQLYVLIGDTQSRSFLVVYLDASGRERLQHAAAHQHQFGHPAHDAYQTVTVVCQILQVVALQTYFHGYGH